MGLTVFQGFPSSSDGKESACNAGDLGLIPGLGRFPGGGHGNPLQYSCLENPHGQRSLAGYSSWGHKEPDTTERLSTHHNSLLDSVGEEEGEMIWQNGIETCIISYMKRVSSPGSMHDTGCLGLVH